MPVVREDQWAEAKAVMLEVDRRTAELLHNRKQMRLHGAVREQRAAARRPDRRLKHGEAQAAIHPEFFHHWGQRLGYECWEDDQFMREFLRDNPECRVRAGTGRIQVGSAGTAAPTKVENKTRFHKSYG